MTTVSEPIHDGGDDAAADGSGARGSARSVPRWRHGLAVAVYIALTVTLTWPLARHVAAKIVLHPKLTFMVSYHHLYLIAWYHHVFDQGLANYWDANIFYPHPRVLTYSESLSAPAAATWPVHLVSRNATLCYNLIVLSAFVLNGLGMYVLALTLGLSWRMALFAGGAIAFCPYMFGEMYCPSMLLLYPAPLLLAAIHRLMRRPTWPGVILVGVCGLWLLTTCYQYTLFCSLFCAGWMLWFIRRMAWRRLWYKLLLVGAVCAALAWPLLGTVKRTHREMGFYKAPKLPMGWLQMLLPASHQRLYRDLLGIQIREDRGDLDPIVCFPGLTFGLLATVGAWTALFGSADSEEARRRRHAYRFCLLASLAAVVLALGLWIRVGPIKIPGPYVLLYWTLSPFRSVRSVYRLYIFGQLFAAILAGLGLRQCLDLASTRTARSLLGATAVLLLLVESVWIPLNLHEVGGRPRDVHPLYQRLAETDPNAPLIELPVPTTVKREPLEALYTFSSIHTWQPLVNGYASYRPGLYEELRPVMAKFPSYEAIRYLRALGVRYVLVRGALMPVKDVQAIKRFPSLREVERYRRDVLYQVANPDRRSLNDWKGTTRFRIERNPEFTRRAWGLAEFDLGLVEVIPVLPGDWGTRWRLTWRDPSDRVIKTETVAVRNSHWLTHDQNALRKSIELPPRPGTYTVEATDQSDGRKLGSCTFTVK